MKKSLVQLLILCSLLFTFTPEVTIPANTGEEVVEEVQPASNVTVEEKNKDY